MKKSKKDLINDILSRNIHHNIRINFAKMPDCTEEDQKNGFDIELIASDFLEFFKQEFEDIDMTPQNDNGNRNLHENWQKKDSLKGKVWTAGRMGATLYWDAYYNEDGRFSRYQDYELEDLSVYELKQIIKDLNFFDCSVSDLMNSYYEECKNRLQDVRLQKIEDDKQEDEYQNILSQVKQKDILKRLINDLI